MEILERRRAARHAERAFQLEHRDWRARTKALAAHLVRHRQACLLGSGFAGGLIVGLLPLRAARLIASTASLVLRSPLGAMLIESMRRHIDDGAGHGAAASRSR